MATGCGKTEIFLNLLAEQLSRNGRRALIISHRQELVYQSITRIKRHWPQLGNCGIVMADRHEPSARVISASVQSLNSGDRLNDILRYGPITHLVTDECFVAGTLVDNEPIESIRPGDAISSGTVVRVFKNKAPDALLRIVADDSEVICTPSHPFLVSLRSGERMWIPAMFLRNGDYVVQCTNQTPKEQKHAENDDVYLPLVRQGIPERQEKQARPIQQGRESVLQSGAREGIVEQTTLNKDGRDKSEICLGTNEAKESNAQSRVEGENADNAASDGMAAGRKGREWATDSIAPEVASVCVGLGNGIPYYVGSQAGQSSASPNLLQSGYSQSDPENCNRGRWFLSRLIGAASAGFQERSGFTRTRVDSVTVLQRGSNGEFERLCPDGFVYNLEVELSHIYIANNFVVHNCHHSTADTYRRVYARLKEAYPALRHVGATATPRRTDQIALEEVFDSVAYRFPISEAIKAGALSPFVALGVYVPAKLVDLPVSSVTGDWSAEAVGKAMTTEAVNAVIVDTWLEKAKGKPTIAFCGSVDQAHSLVEHFQRAGVRAASADYRTKDDVRSGILDDFAAGRIDILANFGLWTEGVDLPMIECVLQSRPTKSGLVYIQAIGRGLRTYPNKDNCLIIDFVPEDTRDLRMAGDLLDGRPLPERKAVEKAEQQGLILDCFGIGRDGKGIDAEPDELLIKVLNYLGQSSLAWTTAKGYATAGLSKERTLAVILPDADALERSTKATRLVAAGEDLSQWDGELRRVQRAASFRLGMINKELKDGRTKFYELQDFGLFESWDDVMYRAEEIADKFGQGILSEKAKSWRRKEATEGQAKYLRPADLWRDGMTRGEAAQALTHHFTGRTLRRKGWIKK
jgi:superfamily II DNA or RNA helicase